MTAPASSSPRRRIPFFVWILLGLVAGVAYGMVSGKSAGNLKFVSDLVLAALRTLATPLIFVAVILALLRAEISGGKGARLLWLILTNTLVAICIGLLVANVLKPGAGADLKPSAAQQHEVEEHQRKVASKKPFDLKEDLLLKLIPRSVAAPFLENDVLAIVLMALATGMALRILRNKGPNHLGLVQNLDRLLETAFETILILLHWLFFAVPIAVFAVVATVVGEKGFGAFRAFGYFVLAVLLALLLQAVFYQIRLRLNSWVGVRHFFKNSLEALATAFSTASSTATLPVTYACAREKIGLRDENARLGTMVGGNLNNDGTALYEAMAALFVAQAIGMNLGFGEQFTIVLMAVVASVGAAGIPEAGLVTMIAVFAAVKLPIEYIPLLLTVDWFLDRCRTAINVMGDLTVSCILDGKHPASPSTAAANET